MVAPQVWLYLNKPWSIYKFTLAVNVGFSYWANVWTDKLNDVQCLSLKIKRFR